MTDTEVKTNLMRSLQVACAWAEVLTLFEGEAGEMAHRMPMPAALRTDGESTLMTYRMAGVIIDSIRQSVALEILEPVPCPPPPEPEPEPIVPAFEPEVEAEKLRTVVIGDDGKLYEAIADDDGGQVKVPVCDECGGEGRRLYGKKMGRCHKCNGTGTAAATVEAEA